ncbi:MAG: tetratricopeptide repeat protein [Blastocatellia bacterium]
MAQEARDYYRNGLTYLQSKQYAKAEVEFRSALNADPQLFDAFYQLAYLYSATGKYKEGEQAIKRYLAVTTETAEALYLLGYLQFRQARVTDSIESLTKSLSLKPTAQAHKILGLNFVIADQPERIQTELTKAKDLDPNDAETAYFLSRFYYTQNRFYQAISEAELAIKLNPGYVKAFDNLGLCYEGLGEKEKAIEYYPQAIALNEKQAGKDEWPYINLGRLLAQKTQLAEAVSYLKRAVAINPASAMARYQLGSALVKLSRHGEAVDEFIASARLDESYPDPHYQLSLVYRKLGRTGDANREMEIFKKLKGY